MLIAHIDESSHSGEARIVSLASFVASEETWRSLDVAWKSALNASEAPHLHMREFAHRRGAFSGRTEDSLRSLLADLLTAIVDHELVAVGAAIDTEGFSALPDEVQRGLIDPFYCCIQEMVFGLAIVGQAADGCSAVYACAMI